MKIIDRNRLKNLIVQEQERFTAAHPISHDLFNQAKSHLLDGVPMNWMVEWAGTFPIFVEGGAGNEDSHLLRGAISGPITEVVAMRLSLGHEEAGGRAAAAAEISSSSNLPCIAPA